MTTTQPRTLNATIIDKDNWHEKKSKLKEKFPHLTDTDLEYEDGKVEDLIDKIHSKIGKTIGKTKEGLHNFIKAL